MASIDRILITSSNALIRQRSTHNFAYVCIAIETLFWTLVHCHILILANIGQFGPKTFFCYFQQGVYFHFIGDYSLFKEIIALLLLIICGL